VNNENVERRDDQGAIWNGDAGHAWVEAQDLLDGMFKPFEDMLVEAVEACERDDVRVLDVGCGAGGTSLAVSRRLGSKGHCLGVDISAPLIQAASARARREGLSTSFLCADAQRHPFQAGGFDLIMSRFGVMFFDDVTAAFGNLRQSARDGALLRFVAWRGPEENPFMTEAERAAKGLLPHMPERHPDEPGQFAFAGRQRLHRLLLDSGWARIDIEPIDVLCIFPEKELLRYVTRMGPLGRVLQALDEPSRRKVVETVRLAFEPYVQGGDVRYTAACWQVSARAHPPASPAL
jgi:SAM-dependent methyltransferase